MDAVVINGPASKMELEMAVEQAAWTMLVRVLCKLDEAITK